ncbi:MAG: DUF3592 domain-containing protein [Panacagrimonas sp.]
MTSTGLTRFLLLGVGTVFVLAAAYLVYEHQRFLARALVTEGTVVDLHVMESSRARRPLANQHRRGSVFVPVIEFRLADGRVQRFESGLRQRPPRFAMQEKVRVRYLPASPDLARLDGFMDRWFKPLIFGGIGMVLLLVGVGVSVAGRSS